MSWFLCWHIEMSEFALGQIRWLKFNWNRMGNELSWCCHTLTGRVTFCLKGYSHLVTQHASLLWLLPTNCSAPRFPLQVCVCVCVCGKGRKTAIHWLISLNYRVIIISISNPHCILYLFYFIGFTRKYYLENF